MKAARWLGALALLGGSGAASAQTAAPACIARPEATLLVTAFLPDILTAAAVRCAPALPPAATLRSGLPALVARLRPESDRAWPRAAQSIDRLVPPALQGLSPDVLRPLATAVVVPLVAGRIAQRDCARIDRAVTLLAPLPARSIAELAVLAIETEAAARPQDAAGLPLCRER